MQMKEYKGAGWGENMKGGGSVLALLHSPISSSSCGPFSPPVGLSVCLCVGSECAITGPPGSF